MVQRVQRRADGRAANGQPVKEYGMDRTELLDRLHDAVSDLTDEQLEQLCATAEAIAQTDNR